MLITPHAFAGAAIGVATGNPILGFGLGLASHFVLDAVPHTDPGTWHFYEPFNTHELDARDFTTGIVDVSIATLGLVALSGVTPIAAAAPVAGIVGGVLPDTFVVIGLFFPKFPKMKFIKWYYDLVEKYHYTARPKQWVLGVVTQLVVILGALWYLFAS